MSAFSRGIGLALSQRIFSFMPKTIPVATSPSFSYRSATSFSQAIRNSPIIQAARNLQTSARLRAPQPQVKSSLNSHSPSAFHAGASRAAAQRLAKLGKPTILYESPSHFWYHFFSIATATFCVTYALMHFYTYVYNPPKDSPSWLPIAFAFICLGMLGMAAYFLLGTSRIVRRITAVPTHLLPKQHLQAGKGQQTPLQANAPVALRDSPVAIEITLSQLSHLLPAKKVVAAPSDVWLSIRMQDLLKDPEVITKAGRVVHQPIPTQDGLMERLADSVQNLWFGAKRALVRGGFMHIKVKGDRYRLDITKGAKVLDDGKTVDHLLPCYPERFAADKTSKFLNT